ncbi:hypothetical protein FH972_019839 [Carpinus fangiana]|uniref:C3HC-type domain-containing protein n=1 Tax=Carpinus fangiana TaxID=176857 RepID=A0A5N6RUH5_9ROSI|nr:hypothetical protein FH972_019839 [Carpinus fangiana]
MAQDSEKRFDSIMDKLFHAPKSLPPNSSSSSGAQLSRGRKRPNTSSALALMEPKTKQHLSGSAGTSDAPLCRPWDRGDLMRRLATFKSMTWFAKPKVVSAVNCARRGWVNVDMDIIACEACGARLLFSTPSSWTQQQVEKAALVFSLKLDNGHKLLCPWIDNACDEALTRFPPTTPPVLVDKFRERCSALSQLLALPVISPSAIECVRSPQLEQFLEQSSMLEYGDGSTNNSRQEYRGSESDADSANLYYQAQKLISLCGWEPRSLPYSVNSKDGPDQSAKNANALTSSYLVANRQNASINLESVSMKEIREAGENSNISTGRQSDPNSVVLDCKLCGASVGLWAFSTVPRPMELFRFVGYAEVNNENESGTHDLGNVNHLDDRAGVVSTSSNGVTSSKDRPTNFNLTIAGGPPPTRQNFKATISLPVIGQNLRARFSYDSEFRDRIYLNQEDVQTDFQNNSLLLEKNDHAENTQGTSPEVGVRNSIESTQNVVQSSCQKGKMPENVENVIPDTSSAKDPGSSQFRDPTTIAPDANTTTRNCESSKDDLPVMVESVNSSFQQISGIDIVQNKAISFATNCMPIPENNEIVTCSSGKDLKKFESDKAMGFDPVRQHRHFCPWITSTGNGATGWQQTLSALLRQKGFSPSPWNSPSANIIKVDDPITSVRRLFMSQSAKRMKMTPLPNPSTKH